MLKLLSFSVRRVQFQRPFTSQKPAISFRKSIKAQRANLLKLLDDEIVPSNNFSSVLEDVSSIKDKNLAVGIVNKFVVIGQTSLQEISLAIQSLQLCGESVKAVELYKSLDVKEALQLSLLLRPNSFTSPLASASLETYRNALNEHHELISEGNLGNSALCMYESLDNVDRVLMDEAIQVKGALQASGVQIHLRTFQSLLFTANKAGFFDIAESLYLEASSTVGPDSSPLVDLETEFMHTLNLRRQYKRVLTIYDRLFKNGGTPTEFTVAHAVKASISLKRYETAIYILNKWHEQGGVSTWTVSHSILQLAVAIDNFVLHRKSPLVAPENINQDGVMYNRAKPFNIYKVRVFNPSKKAVDETVNSEVQKPVEVESAVPHDSSYDHVAEGALLTVNVDELQEGIDGEATTEVTVESVASAAVNDSSTTHKKEKSSRLKQPDRTHRPQFSTREERLTFFSEYLVRRVLVRIDQGFDIGLRRHRRESVAPEDVLALACGHMAMRGSLDRLLDKLQGGALEVDKTEELLPLVQRLFVCAPIQMLRYKGHWRELMGLVERMEAYRSQIPNVVFAAAVSRSVSALFDNRQETRAVWQMTRHLDSLMATEETEAFFLRIMQSTDSLCLPHVMSGLHKAGRNVHESYLLHALGVCKTKGELFWCCKAYAETSGEVKKVLSDSVCDKIAATSANVVIFRKIGLPVLEQWTSVFSMTPEQIECISKSFVGPTLKAPEKDVSAQEVV